ncbi:MAG: thioredoxin [Chitinophagales bacterium]|nr:thioredoxin [Chitinophagales bacterium]
MKIVNIFIALVFLTSACKSNNNQNAESQSPIATTINITDFDTKLHEATNAQLIDVRTPEEYNGGHIENAINYNWNGDFKTQIENLDKDQPVFIYCLSGGRSGQAMNYLQSQGFKEVYNLQGGVMAWENAGKTLTQSTSNTEKENTLSTDDYQKLTTSSNLVLVDFFAPWCAPCKKLSPIVEELEQTMNGTFKLQKINYDDNKDLAKSNGVVAIPVLILYKAGKEVWRQNGLADKATIKAAINQFK